MRQSDRHGVIFLGFGRKRPNSPIEQLKSGRWRFAGCDVEHGWLFDLAAHAPDPWPHARDYEPNSALRLGDDFLSEDFCVLDDEYFMIRAVLMIPVVGLDDAFGFRCWSTLSRENLEAYIAGFDTGEHADFNAMSGWLCNQLADYIGSDSLAVWVKPRPGRQRPLLWVMDDDHPLAIAQEIGISAERVLEVFSHYGHDPRH